MSLSFIFTNPPEDEKNNKIEKKLVKFSDDSQKKTIKTTNIFVVTNCVRSRHKKRNKERTKNTRTEQKKAKTNNNNNNNKNKKQEKEDRSQQGAESRGQLRRVILFGELFVHIFHIFFAPFFNLPFFSCFFFQINIGMLTNLIFLLLSGEFHEL